MNEVDFLRAIRSDYPNINSKLLELVKCNNGIVKNENEYIYLRADRKNIKVKLSDLLFIESLKDYIKVVTKDRTIVSKNSISVLEERLPASFIRIHRSFIVSVNKIDSFTHDLIQIGKFELPVSRSYRHQVEKVLHI